jgi:probable phosphoglycerate mutase
VSIRTELLLTRHGEAVCNARGIVGGPASCTGLTDQGRRQVHALASALREEHQRHRFDVLYTSPRPRTRESAAILTDLLDLDPIVLDDLRGPDHGNADGHPWAQVKAAFGGNPQRHPDRAHAAGAEAWNTYLHRAAGTIRRILADHDGQRILVAGHGETVLAANSLLLELPTGLSARAGFTVDHAALTWWQQHVNRFGHPTWMLTRHNDTRHLDHPEPPQPVTETATGQEPVVKRVAP